MKMGEFETRRERLLVVTTKTRLRKKSGGNVNLVRETRMGTRCVGRKEANKS